MILESWFSHNAIHETYYSMGYMTSKKEKHNIQQINQTRWSLTPFNILTISIKKANARLQTPLRATCTLETIVLLPLHTNQHLEEWSINYQFIDLKEININSQSLNTHKAQGIPNPTSKRFLKHNLHNKLFNTLLFSITNLKYWEPPILKLLRTSYYDN